MPNQIFSFQIEMIPDIEQAELLTVRLPFIHAFSTSAHTWETKDALLLRLSSGGVSGWGECVADPDPFYSPETTTSAAYIIKEFLLPLIKPQMTLIELEKAFRHIRGNGMAKAAVENAVIDLMAKIKGVPLYQFLGFGKRKILSGLSLGLQPTIDDLLIRVQEAMDKKYRRVKMKIKRGQDIAWVKAVRDHFPNLPLMVDANGDYSLDDAVHLAKLDAFNLMMIEQPLSYSDIYQHSKLQRCIATALCLDESIHSLDSAITAVELGSCRIINIKQGRVGGLTEALRIARYCSEQGVDIWSGGMDETGVGRAFNIHLQSDPDFNLPGDTSETRRYFKEDIVDPPVTLDADGLIDIPEGAGIGVRILEDRLQRFRIDDHAGSFVLR
jgi:O-succinylbenzoate synthase